MLHDAAIETVAVVATEPAIAAAALVGILLGRYVPQTRRHVRNRSQKVVWPVQSFTRSCHLVVVYGVIVAWGLYRLLTLTFALTNVAIGVGLCGAGASMGIAAARALGDQYCEELLRYDGQRLVTTGIYSIIRHPARLGMFIEACGVCVLARTPFIIVLLTILAGIQYLRTAEEDAMLLVACGTSAVDYRRKVPAFNLLAGAVRHIMRERRTAAEPSCGVVAKGAVGGHVG